MNDTPAPGHAVTPVTGLPHVVYGPAMNPDPVHPPDAPRAHLTGYAAGSTDGDGWLTVWGSGLRGVESLIFPTREQAEQHALKLRAAVSSSMHRDRLIVARVEVHGLAFDQDVRILPDGVLPFRS